MHEFGIASEIWQAVRQAAEWHGGRSPSASLGVNKLLPNAPVRVLSITVELGELNLIEDEQLRFWVTALAERDGSPDIELRITHMPVTVRCRQCGEESAVARPPEAAATAAEGLAVELTGQQPGLFVPPVVACPRCGSKDVEAIGGREIRVVSAEIEPEATSPPSLPTTGGQAPSPRAERAGQGEMGSSEEAG